MKIRLRPEHIYPASDLVRFRWPKSQFHRFFTPLCRDNGQELSWFESEHLPYLPHEKVSLYVRMGVIARVVISGELSVVNDEIRQNWVRQGNTQRCVIYLAEAYDGPSKSVTQAEIDAGAHELNWGRLPNSNGTGIVLGDSESPSAVRRLMRMELAPGKHTKQEWRQIMQRDGWKCLRCGSMKRLTKDHVVPIAKGGSNDAGNLQVLCASCNSWKGAKHIDFRISTPASDVAAR